MSLLFGRQTRSWIAERPISPVYLGTGSGSAWNASPEGALVVPTVFRCVSLLANAVAMLSLEHYRYGPTGLPKVINRSSFVEGLTGDLRQSEWLHMLMVSLLLRGNGLGKVVARDGMARPRQVSLLNPDTVRVEVDPDNGKLSYKIARSGADITADIWHVRGMTLPGSMIGLSPISYAAATIGVDLGSRQFAHDFFGGGGVPKAVLQTDQDVNQEQARTIKDRLLAATRNREPVVLGRGLQYQQISVSPEESQFLLTQQANISQIAGYFGPTLPVMVGGNDGSSMTYSNRVDRANDFLTYDVQTWLTRIQDAITSLLPANEFVRFNTAALLRMDARTQAEVDNMQLAGKTRVPSELRERDGLQPMTEAQQVEADMVPLTITPGGGAKALPALKTPPGPEAPVPAAEMQTNSAPNTP